MTARRVLAATAVAILAAAVLLALPSRPAPSQEPRRPTELPPTASEISEHFRAARGDFEAHLALVLALPSPAVTLQRDFFAWGDNEQRTEMNPGRWWAPDESWVDTAAVLEGVGLDAAEFARLKAFLEKTGLHVISKGSCFEDGESEVKFLFAQGLQNVRIERVLVWHRDPRPRTQEAMRRVSKDRAYPQHMREIPLAVPGWFVRETTVDWP
jgi:hypothetical protein